MPGSNTYWVWTWLGRLVGREIERFVQSPHPLLGPPGFGKLNVRNRTQCVPRARELRLLEQKSHALDPAASFRANPELA